MRKERPALTDELLFLSSYIINGMKSNSLRESSLMTLSDISSRSAVEAAIGEFDVIGRDAFLRKYGFGQAQRYFLLFRGVRYDSKAIIGAAHGYQFPELGPLTPRSFSGGELTVARKLRSLGYEVWSTDIEKREPAFWAFCANPKRYRIREALDHFEMDYWTVGKSDIKAGDQAVIWQTLDRDHHRGVVAFAEILTDPEPRTDSDNPYWVNPGEGTEKILRVKVNYTVPKNLPLWVDSSEAGIFLRSLSVAKATGGTIFKITKEQWNELTRLAQYSRTSQLEIDSRELLRYRSTAVGGQGFGLSSSERRLVEEYAMSIAYSYLMQNWPSVTDVSARSSFDLLCKRGDEELRVEVKGTTNTGCRIILTRREVSEAQQPDYALFIVSEIVLDRNNPIMPVASGGVARIFSPWRPSEEALQPLSFSCDIDIEQGIIVE